MAIDCDITLRYCGVTTDNNIEIPGICIGYASYKEALQGVDQFIKYATYSGQKSLSVIFKSKGNGSYDSSIMLDHPELYLNISVFDIGPEHVERLVDKLSNSTYYFIMIGYELNGEFVLIPEKQFRLFKRDVVVDGELIMGRVNQLIDWSKILS